MGSVLANSNVKLQDLQKDTASRATKCDHDQARDIKTLQHRDSGDAIACLLGPDRNISTTTGWMAWKSGTDVTNSDSEFIKSFPIVAFFLLTRSSDPQSSIISGQASSSATRAACYLCIYGCESFQRYKGPNFRVQPHRLWGAPWWISHGGLILNYWSSNQKHNERWDITWNQ